MGDLGKDLGAGKAVLYNYCGSSYQNWDKGSSLIFWRWNDTTLAREGFLPYIKEALPTSQGRARVKLKDKDLIFAKIIKYINKGYLIICEHA